MPRTVVYGLDRSHTEAVESGRKRRTIRPVGRRRHAEPGDTVRIFEGMRTRACRLVVEGVRVSARPVLLRLGPGGLLGGTDGGAPIRDADEFARLDGFSGAAEMGAFFSGLHGHGDFAGVLIEWAPHESRGP